MALSLDSSNTRRRRRGRTRRALSEINVTPLVDVMLVLLIIFMISAPLLTVGIEVDLPQTEAGAVEEQSEPLTITVKSNGQIYVQNSEVSFGSLRGVLENMGAAGSFERPVYVKGESSANYAVVAQVLAVLSTSGFHKIGLITDPGGPPSDQKAATP